MIDSGTSARLLHSEATQALGAQAAAASGKAAVDTTQKGIACPYCGRPMEAARLFGVDVDVCPTHGTWFDRDELRRIADAALALGRGPTRRAAAGAALVGAAAMAGAGGAAPAAALAERPGHVSQAATASDLGTGAAQVAEGVGDVVYAGVEIAAQADSLGGGAAAVAESAAAVAESAGEVFGAVLSALGAIFDGF